MLKGSAYTDRPAVSDRTATRSWLPWLLVSLLAAAGLRLALAQVTAPVVYPDSAGYIELGKALLAGDLTHDTGTRTPVYPIFTALLGFRPEAIQFAQNALGVLGTALAFYGGWLLSRRGWVAALVASTYGLSLGQIWFENTLLTEALTTVLVTAAMVSLTFVLSRKASTPAYLALGIAVGILTLERPQYLALPLVVLGALVLARTPRRRLALVALLALAPVLVWSGFNQYRFGVFTPTTLGGLNMMNQAGYYMADAPDEYAPIREVFLKSTAEHGGDPSSVVWYTLPELQRVTGQSVPQLSQTLGKLGVHLLAEHPVPYLRRSLGDLGRFWSGFRWQFKTETAPIRPAIIASVVERWVLFVLFTLTWVVATAATAKDLIAAIRRRAPLPSRTLLLAALLGTTLVAALPAVLMEHGDSGRYGLPLQPTAALMTLVLVQALSHGKAQAGDGSLHPSDGRTVDVLAVPQLEHE